MPKYHYKNLPSQKPTVIHSPIYSEFETVQKVKVIDASKELYEIYDDLVVTKEIDTDKLAQSFGGSTSVEAVFKKVAITGDTTLFNTQTGDSFVDATQLPKDLYEAKLLAKKGNIAATSLSKALNKDASDNAELLKSITQQDLINYINSIVESKISSKSEVKVNE